MKLFRINTNGALAFADPFRVPGFGALPDPARKREPAAERPAAADAAMEQPLWKRSLDAGAELTSLPVRICFALFAGSAAAAVGYAFHQLYSLMRADALDRAVQAFIG